MATEDPEPDPHLWATSTVHELSDLPKRIIELLQKHKRMTLLELAGELYGDGPGRALSGSIINAMERQAAQSRQHGRILSALQTLRLAEVVGASNKAGDGAGVHSFVQPADVVYWLIPDMLNPQAVLDFLTQDD